MKNIVFFQFSFSINLGLELETNPKTFGFQLYIYFLFLFFILSYFNIFYYYYVKYFEDNLVFLLILSGNFVFSCSVIIKNFSLIELTRGKKERFV